MKILFVCTGNTCRSPLAAAYLRKQRPEWQVESAGVAATPGVAASGDALVVARENDLDLDSHKAQSLKDVVLSDFDRVFTMSRKHLKALTEEKTSVSLLSCDNGEAKDVADPYGQGLEAYRKAFSQIKSSIDRLLPELKDNRGLIPERSDYGDRELRKGDLLADPVKLFEVWMAEAVEAGVPEANAVCLCTVDEVGQPDGRMVLLKGISERGLFFYTNHGSRKGSQLHHNPRAGMVFWWESLKRQVRVAGRVERAEASASDDYFRSRPRGSQLGAWASRQSSPIESREVLERAFEEAEEKFPDDIPRPEFWGGYILVPSRLEFWQGRTSRLHDRFEYLLDEATGDWSTRRLMP